MISVYKVMEYIHIIVNKRRRFYYLRHKLQGERLNRKGLQVLKDTAAAVSELNKVLKLLRSCNGGDLISVNAVGGYLIQSGLTTIASGCFNCAILGGMQ